MSRAETISVPTARPLTRGQRMVWALRGLLSPLYALRARQYQTPGLAWHVSGINLAMLALMRRSAGVPWPVLYRLVAFPLDSTRYFEFDFFWRSSREGRVREYLDVASPRLFPIVLLRKHSRAQADFINPDRADLSLTQSLVRAARLARRCRLSPDTVATFRPADAAAYDLITSMSVLEHIPDDKAAVANLWRLLKPQGRLLLSVPCARVASEQHIDRDEYGVLPPDAHGVWFWQRFYDRSLLEDRILSITGQPTRFQVFGEAVPGTFQLNAARKRSDRSYPLWRESLMTGRHFRYFPDIADLPGEGVIAMEFHKP